SNRGAPMSQVTDIWYVRFPDGRVLKAPSTDALRQHLGTGQIPFASRVRRSDEEEWVALDWTEEFADLVLPGGAATPASASSHRREWFTMGGEWANLASRLDPTRLRTVGLRGLAEELVAALDSTMSRRKLLTAGAVGFVGGIVAALVASSVELLPWPLSWWIWAAAAVLVLAVGVGANVLLTQLTYIELSRLRPARWTEARVGWTKF